jgi:SAM-dependent methyltransferase
MTTNHHSSQHRWPPEHSGFFGPFYYRGDHSIEGYLPDRPLSNDARTQREVAGIERLLNLDPENPQEILDAPCGYGRHTVALTRLGHKVTGLDLCQRFVEAATDQLERLGMGGIVRQGELIELPFADNSFDIALNLFFSFGFYLDDADNETCVREYSRVLRPGGRLLFHTDVNVPLIAADRYRQPTRRRLEDGGRLTISENLNWMTRRLDGKWTIDDGQESDPLERRYSLRVYTHAEFAEMCEKAGLEPIAIYGGFDDETAHYSDMSEEMIVIAEKR